MKPRFEDIGSKQGTDSYVAYRYDTDFFPFLWHYHPEYELTLILDGSGERMVGDSHEYFIPGDLVLLGTGLPHTWVSKASSSAVVIQFSETFMAPLLRYPECDRIRQLLARSAQGLVFPAGEADGLREADAGLLEPDAGLTEAGVDDLRAAVERLPGLKGVGRITGLLEVLNALGDQGAGALSLASPYFQPASGKRTEGRIGKVFQYVHRHSSEVVSLAEMAALINLSESAFCKFFKRTTGRTFSDYLTDIRIGHACHLLSETDDTISAIAWQSGFDSLTYFNRVFLRKKGVRPREFRRDKQRVNG